MLAKDQKKYSPGYVKSGNQPAEDESTGEKSIHLQRPSRFKVFNLFKIDAKKLREALEITFWK